MLQKTKKPNEVKTTSLRDDETLKAAAKKAVIPEVDVLLRAADYIEEHGWIQGNRTGSCGVCLVGAIEMVSNGKITIASAEGYYLPDVARVSKVVGCDAWIWNDRNGRTKEQVVSILRQMAATYPE